MVKKVLKKVVSGLGYDVQKKQVQGVPNEVVTEANNNEKYLIESKDGIDLFDTPTGKYYLPNNASGDIVINAIKRGEYFDINILRVAERFVEKGTSVLDVGANFGQMSIFFSSLVGEKGKVYAFDADDFVFEIFKKNIKNNNCINVIPVFGAVYNINGKFFTFPKQSPYQLEIAAYGSYGINPKLEEGRKVKSLTIDSLEIKEKISFMKVDVQGSDLFAMEGATELIAKNQMPIIFEFEQQFQDDFNTTFQSYVDFVESINYKFAEVIDGINYLIVPKNIA